MENTKILHWLKDHDWKKESKSLVVEIVWSSSCIVTVALSEILSLLNLCPISTYRRVICTARCTRPPHHWLHVRRESNRGLALLTERDGEHRKALETSLVLHISAFDNQVQTDSTDVSFWEVDLKRQFAKKNEFGHYALYSYLMCGRYFEKCSSMFFKSMGTNIVGLLQNILRCKNVIFKAVK